MKHDLRRWMKLCETSGEPILPIDIAEDRCSDVYTDLGTCERVVWEKDSVIETNELSSVGFDPDVVGVYGVHVTNDPEFWFNQLVNDYDRDPLAYVIEIQCLDTDVLVEDPQIIDRTGVSTGVLLTTRKQLIMGRDFKIVKTLTEADLDEVYGEEDGEEEEDGENW